MPDPTAKWYDLIYDLDGKDYPAEVAELIELIDQRMPKATSLLDVACGTGRHLELLAGRFADLAGVDLSPEMLDIAAGRVGSIPLHQADMCEMDLRRRFDVVTCLFSAVGHLPDTAALERAMVRLGEHLEEHVELTMFTEDEYRAAFSAAGLSMKVLASPMPGRDWYLGVRDER